MNKSKAERTLRFTVMVIVTVFISFLTAKLCGILPWSWWWIFAPVWMPVLAGVLLAGIFFLVVILGCHITYGKK